MTPKELDDFLNPALRDIFSTPNTQSLRSLFDLLQAEQAFPSPLVFGPEGDIWISGPTIHGQSRTTYPNRTTSGQVMIDRLAPTRTYPKLI